MVAEDAAPFPFLEEGYCGSEAKVAADGLKHVGLSFPF